VALTFRGTLDFFGPKMALLSLVPFNGPKKSRGPSKSLDFLPVPFSDFQGLISLFPDTFTAEGHK
jgi:hypothetical protein